MEFKSMDTFNVDVFVLIFNKLTERESLIFCLSCKKMYKAFASLIPSHFLKPHQYLKNSLFFYFKSKPSMDEFVIIHTDFQNDFLDLDSFLHKKAKDIASNYSFKTLQNQILDTVVVLSSNFQYAPNLKIQCSFKIQFFRRKNKYTSHVLSFFVCQV